MTTELMACPFCGGEWKLKFRERESSTYPFFRPEHWAECIECKMKTHHYPSKTALVEYINTRHTQMVEPEKMEEYLSERAEIWISVEDRLPKVGERVLFVCLIEGACWDIEIGEWTGEHTQGDAIVMDYGDDDDWLPCTHWMPLPHSPLGTDEPVGEEKLNAETDNR